jgi:NADPH:quinone reductase-like Zn-dependent oxidoreductase
MRAAVVHEPGATPVLEQFADPQPGRGVSVATLLAAALNPVDVVVVNDQFPIRPLTPPSIAGYEGLAQLTDLGADAVVDLADEQTIVAGLADAAPGGYDVIVDFLWGEAAPHAMSHANFGARYVQVGGSAGDTAMISSASIRNKLMTVMGHGLFAAPVDARRAAYAQMVPHALEGEFAMDLEQTPLDDISATWERLKTGAPRKLVVVP